MVSLQTEAIRPATYFRLFAALLCVAASLSFSTIARCGSARDYLNAPIDSWLTTYNASYSASVTPEDGMDISSRTRSNVFGQSLVVTRTMDYWGRTGGLSVFSSGQYEWRFRHWLPLANEYLRRTRAHARTIPIIRSGDVFQLSSLRRNSAWHVQSNLAN